MIAVVFSMDIIDVLLHIVDDSCVVVVNGVLFEVVFSIVMVDDVVQLTRSIWIAGYPFALVAKRGLVDFL